MKKKELNDHFYQVSEKIFDKRDIKKLMMLYGDKGLKYWLKIELDLLTNDGIGEWDWKYYSTNEYDCVNPQATDKEVIEYLMSTHEKNEDGTFSSIRVNKQLEERKNISEINTKNIKEYWRKRKQTEQSTKIKPEPNKNEKVDLDELDGIKKSGKKKKIDDDEHDDIYI